MKKENLPQEMLISDWNDLSRRDYRCLVTLMELWEEGNLEALEPVQDRSLLVLTTSKVKKALMSFPPITTNANFAAFITHVAEDIEQFCTTSFGRQHYISTTKCSKRPNYKYKFGD